MMSNCIVRIWQISTLPNIVNLLFDLKTVNLIFVFPGEAVLLKLFLIINKQTILNSWKITKTHLHKEPLKQMWKLKVDCEDVY